MGKTKEPAIGQTPRTRKAVGRPPKLSPLDRAVVYEAFNAYIENEEDPTIVGFCAWNDTAISYKLTKDNMYDWSEFSELRKRAIEKQEANLLKKAGNGSYNATIAIFRLKQPQHGYSDRVDSDITSKGEQLGQAISPEQAAQLLKLRAERASS